MLTLLHSVSQDVWFPFTEGHFPFTPRQCCSHLLLTPAPSVLTGLFGSPAQSHCIKKACPELVKSYNIVTTFLWYFSFYPQSKSVLIMYSKLTLWDNINPSTAPILSQCWSLYSGSAPVASSAGGSNTNKHKLTRARSPTSSWITQTAVEATLRCGQSCFVGITSRL